MPGFRRAAPVSAGRTATFSSAGLERANKLADARQINVLRFTTTSPEKQLACPIFSPSKVVSVVQLSISSAGGRRSFLSKHRSQSPAPWFHRAQGAVSLAVVFVCPPALPFSLSPHPWQPAKVQIRAFEDPTQLSPPHLLYDSFAAPEGASRRACAPAAATLSQGRSL